MGYGFVKFKNEADALAAIEFKNGFTIGTKTIKVSLARPASDDIRNCKLYITNLPRLYQEQDVEKLFSRFGDIIECRVLKDGKGSKMSKGVAFVQFNRRIQAEAGMILFIYMNILYETSFYETNQP